ncbi:MAG TPA: alpha-1,4-glucan--maltose-1-phosphate maltosyltransferase [Casimicrobiaceae bacterium]|nr:alpha-1,4-glucan--maltose-1-phosphate maltosyltransferase [Casimicrobiaceae bacterium]
MTGSPTTAKDGRVRVVIEAVRSAVDSGRFPVKRVVGDKVCVEADCFADGHDQLVCLLLYRREDETAWRSSPMRALGNDRWRGAFTVDSLGSYRYTVTAWVDQFLSWRHDFERRIDAEDLRVAAIVGASLVEAAAGRAQGPDREKLTDWARRLRSEQDPATLRAIALDKSLDRLARRFPDRSLAATHQVELRVTVDRALARCGAWYELFPRSCSATPGAYGTLADCAARLPYIAAMGFDVVYLPPIHPVGRARRKGRNNTLGAAPNDPGSPWAIGAAEGGHTAIHPQLGTLEDLRHFLAQAKEHGLEVALDIALQCAPDHPWVASHPQWFRHRPDGSVQYAENPPKKYQDIYPLNFETDDWQALWRELAGVFTFWIGQGVRIFRVDNPHTKPFAFWEWVIGEIKREHPDVILLSEAFTRPKVMHRLAKVGFTQSYTYFAWRNTKRELTDYFTELANGSGREYFRPNCWPNTPDILTEYLQFGGRPAFMARLVLAATLSASYGIYGPAFELMEHEPREPGSEEYLNSEKYEIRRWELDRADSLAPYVARVNRARRENPALQQDWSLVFFPVDNEQIICYAKTTDEPDNAVVVVVNLDPAHVQSGWIEVDLEALDIDADRSYQMHDLITGARHLWSGARNFVALDPSRSPAHIFRVRRRVHREHDFDYFM